MKHALAALLLVTTALFAGGKPSTAGDDVEERLGDALTVATAAGAFLTTVAADDPAGRSQFYKGFLLSLGSTTALKLVIDKERPDGSGDDAFPSRHTAVAFQGASFLQVRYGWQTGVPAYAAASLVGWSRLVTDRHDPADVLAGAAIGVLSSYLFTKPLAGVVVTPLAGAGLYGARVELRW